ncbi:hypothetical protein MKEN_00938600 [Mycena kentingensis (nom. inval.)]|nr:hypothetical protein MKEN_00938600 [Mycena kentingensis (nom. inval.)]
MQLRLAPLPCPSFCAYSALRSKPASDDYETILADLASNVQKRQQQLADIRQRERRASTLVTLYTLAGWLVYLGVWYFGFVSGGRGHKVQVAERVVRALPVFVGPIFILFIRRIVQLWYNRKGNQEEKSLQALLKEQRTKVEEIKKKTNFYSTRDLLSRYDQQSAPGTPQRGPQQPPPSAGPQGQAPRKSGVPPPPNGQSLSISTATAPPRPQEPPRRTLFDSLADLLVGGEDQAPASQKYALICEKCFAHNGLVHEAAWPDAQYKCPQCGHFNASARSRKVLERANAANLGSPPLSAQFPPATPMSGATAPSVSTAVNEKVARKRAGKVKARGEECGSGEERMEVDEEE